MIEKIIKEQNLSAAQVWNSAKRSQRCSSVFCLLYNNNVEVRDAYGICFDSSNMKEDFHSMFQKFESGIIMDFIRTI